jgi:hypothetical protein
MWLFLFFERVEEVKSMQRMLCNLIANTNLYDSLPCISSLEADAFTSKNTTPVAEYNNEHRRKMNINALLSCRLMWYLQLYTVISAE